jgi:diaminopimelate decarboxylase
MSQTRIDDCLSNRDGILFIEELASTELIEQFGSPLFVFSENQIRRNVRRFRDAFERGWTAGPVKVMPAAKASWTLAVQRILADEGCGADIYSAGELDVALRAGVEPRYISANGVPKDREHVRRTIETGARLTIDSLRDVELLEELAPTLSKTAYVRLRIRPAISGFIKKSDFVAEGVVPTDIAALLYKGGLSVDEVIEAGRRVMKLDNAEIVGFHAHHGRHHPSTAYWQAQMQAYARDMGRVSTALGGYQPQEISVGGGFAIPRDPHNAATHYSDPVAFGALHLLSLGLKYFGSKVRYAVIDKLMAVVKGHPNAVPAPRIEDYGSTTTTALLQALPKHGIDPSGVMLQLEPGRAIHGDAGVHLSTVQATKKMTSPIRWNIVTIDTSEFWMAGGRFEHHLHDYRIANRLNAPAAMKADVTGRSCYGDRLLGAVDLPDVEVGDIFALLDTGAYQEVSASNFNAMPRPAAVLVTRDRAAVIRRAESLEDVFRRDELPDHLAPTEVPADDSAELSDSSKTSSQEAARSAS